MKALIRNEGETVLETSGIDGINWFTGEPLTNADWCGGSYKLINDYSPLEIEPEISGDPLNI